MSKRVTTRAVFDIESGACLERESYLYDGPWATLAPVTLKGEDDSYWYGDFYLGRIVTGIAAAAATAVLFTSLLAGQVANAQQDEIGAVSLPSIAVEDYQRSAVPPVPAILYQPLPYLPDPEEIPAGSLFGQPDEDFWQNPTAPIPATLSWPQPWTFDIQESAGSLFGQPDEDFWLNPVAPVPATLGKLYLPDPEEIPAGNLKVDPSSQPSIAILAIPQYSSTVLLVGDDEVLPVAAPPVFSPDEDYWRNAVVPTPATLYQPLPYLPDPEELPAATLSGQPDEDYWNNPTAPIPATLLWPQPWAFDVQEPAGSLFGQADEDFDWRALFGVPWPQPAGTNWLAVQQWLWDVQEPAGSLFGQPDEDYWQNPVVPVPSSLYQKLPYLPDPEELPAGSLLGQPDEDYWQNPVSPVSAALYQHLPYLPDSEELVVIAPLPFQPDEDYWQNQVLPVQAIFISAQPPWLFERLPTAAPPPPAVRGRSARLGFIFQLHR